MSWSPYDIEGGSCLEIRDSLASARSASSPSHAAPPPAASGERITNVVSHFETRNLCPRESSSRIVVRRSLLDRGFEEDASGQQETEVGELARPHKATAVRDSSFAQPPPRHHVETRHSGAIDVSSIKDAAEVQSSPRPSCQCCRWQSTRCLMTMILLQGRPIVICVSLSRRGSRMSMLPRSWRPRMS